MCVCVRVCAYVCVSAQLFINIHNDLKCGINIESVDLLVCGKLVIRSFSFSSISSVLLTKLGI